MTILGIDPGSHTCGYALAELHEDGRIDLITCGDVTNHARDTHRRVKFIYEGVERVLTQHGVSDFSMGYEIPYNRAFGTEQLWTVIGALMPLSRTAVPIHVKTAHSAWGRNPKLNREEGKKASVDAANAAFGLQLGYDQADAADAIWIAVATAKKEMKK